METRGTVKNISISYPSRNAILTCEVVANPEDCEEYLEKDLDIKLTVHRERRSLNANSYFHKLCDLLRQKLGQSFAWTKNSLITTYGQIWYLDNSEPWIYKTNAPYEVVMELEEHHLKFIKADPNEDGICWYRVYRGSHTYNTAEMAQLIDGTVYECREQGIETLPPYKLEELKKAWTP